MYAMRYTNPKLCGYIYRRKVRCGKTNCKCAKDNKYRHTAYYVQFREWVNGKWKRRSEYVPKAKVKALRARIRRAKERDRKMQEKTREFIKEMPRLVKRIKHNPFDISALDGAKKLMKSLDTKAPLTQSQRWKIIDILASVVAAIVSPPKSRNE